MEGAHAPDAGGAQTQCNVSALLRLSPTTSGPVTFVGSSPGVDRGTVPLTASPQTHIVIEDSHYDASGSPATQEQPPPPVRKRPAARQATPLLQEDGATEPYLELGANLICPCGWNPPKTTGTWKYELADRHWLSCQGRRFPRRIIAGGVCRYWAGRQAVITAAARRRYDAFLNKLPERLRDKAHALEDFPSETLSKEQGTGGKILQMYRCTQCFIAFTAARAARSPCHAKVSDIAKGVKPSWQTLGYIIPRKVKPAFRSSLNLFRVWRAALSASDRRSACIVRFNAAVAADVSRAKPACFSCKRNCKKPCGEALYFTRGPCKAVKLNRPEKTAWMQRNSPKHLERLVALRDKTKTRRFAARQALNVNDTPANSSSSALGPKALPPDRS